LAVWAAEARGKRGRARAGGYACCRGAERRARLASDARERGRGEGEKRKREARRLEASIAERATRRRRAGARVAGGREEGES
jgi:hypothetical protein